MAHYDTFSVYIYGLFTYFHVFFFVIIVCKFVYKLREVHKACVALSTKASTSSVNAMLDTVSDNNNFLIVIITRQSVLSTICLIPFIIRFTFRKILGFYDEDILPEFLWMISYIGRDIVLLLTSLYIYLSMKFNVKQYQLFCKSCDKCCYTLCTFFVTSQNETKLFRKSIEMETSYNMKSVGDSNVTSDKKSELTLTVMSIPTSTNSGSTVNNTTSISGEKNKPLDDIN
eukprot:121773_1